LATDTGRGILCACAPAALAALKLYRGRRHRDGTVPRPQESLAPAKRRGPQSAAGHLVRPRRRQASPLPDDDQRSRGGAWTRIAGTIAAISPGRAHERVFALRPPSRLPGASTSPPPLRNDGMDDVQYLGAFRPGATSPGDPGNWLDTARTGSASPRT